MAEIIWRFVRIGLPPNYPFLDGIFHGKKTSILGYHHLWKPPSVNGRISVAMFDCRVAFLRGSVHIPENDQPMPWYLFLTESNMRH